MMPVAALYMTVNIFQRVLKKLYKISLNVFLLIFGVDSGIQTSKSLFAGSLQLLLGKVRAIFAKPN